MEVPRRYKSQTNSTKAGKVCPLSFQLTDIGSRCAEAGNPTTFLGPQPTVTQVCMIEWMSLPDYVLTRG